MAFRYIIIRSPYTPYSIYLRGTIGCRAAMGIGWGLFKVKGTCRACLSFVLRLGTDRPVRITAFETWGVPK